MRHKPQPQEGAPSDLDAHAALARARSPAPSIASLSSLTGAAPPPPGGATSRLRGGGSVTPGGGGGGGEEGVVVVRYGALQRSRRVSSVPSTPRGAGESTLLSPLPCLACFSLAAAAM